MEGIGARLPLTRSTEYGVYDLVTSYHEEIRQNFKNLLLTSPGERIMNPSFGVGVRRFLFEQRDEILPSLQSRIEEQVETYMPYITINNIIFDNDNPNPDDLIDRHIVSISIEYEIPDFNLSSSITVTTSGIA